MCFICIYSHTQVKRKRHPRESGDPKILAKTLDSRFRGNDVVCFYLTMVQGYFYTNFNSLEFDGVKNKKGSYRDLS